MAGSPKVFKIFLICSNVILLCAGLTVFILGIKMYLALSVLSLIDIPLIKNVVNTIIATGVFISICGLLGLLGACNESKCLIFGHLTSLGVIVILEFSIGVTLFMVKKSVSAAVESSDCNNVCTASFDAIILDYALPSAGLMMSVIFIEASMIYCSLRLYFFIKDRPNVTLVSGPSIVVQNVQMQNVPSTQAAYITPPQTVYVSPMEYVPHQPRFSHVYEVVGAVHRTQSDAEDKPPDYNTLTHFPPAYVNDVEYNAAGASTSEEQPNNLDENFNEV